MAISKDLKDGAQMTREDGVFTLKLDEGVSLAMLVSFSQDMFPDRSPEDIGVWPGSGGRAGSLGARRRSSPFELTAETGPLATAVRRWHARVGIKVS